MANEIINPKTGETPDPRNTMGMSASGLVDPTELTRPVVKIKDVKAARGFRIVNLEDYRPETMTKIGDVIRPGGGDKPAELTIDPVLSKTKDNEEDVGDGDEYEIDLDSMKKNELVQFAEEQEIEINPKAGVHDIREMIREALEIE